MSRDYPDSKNATAGKEFTRREWLLRLGEFTVLAGVAGMAPGFPAELRAAEEPSAFTLPPGLYEPSPKHLMHALAEQGAPAVLPGSETDYVRPRQGPYQPLFFSSGEFAVINRLLEVMLGKVEAGALANTAEWLDLYLHAAAAVRQAALALDPAHRALAIAFFGGDKEVRELETSDPQATARSGLEAFSVRVQQNFGENFLQLRSEQQLDALRAISQSPAGSPLRRFYDLLRREAIRGYYSTAAGLRELDYKGNAYYTECPGCQQKSESGSHT